VDFEDLKDFIENKMKMQHVYQPVMIKTLLKSDKNRASTRVIAKEFSNLDESQIDYYKVITRQMPGRVLKKHGVVFETLDGYSLNISYLTESQRMDLIDLCDQKIGEYIHTKGGERRLWLYRMKSTSYIPGTVRCEVLKRAKGRCELCGVPASQKFLQVDHILPRNKGGKSTIDNYQALCYTCNAQKMDKDSTDFREWKFIYDKKEKECPFCEMNHISSKIIDKNGSAVAFKDKYPVVKDHALVIPFRHVTSFFELGNFEKRACLLLVESVRKKVLEGDRTITGFNVGFNDGLDAGQTIFHCHIHVIPRRKNDVQNPAGGIRNVIRSKGIY